jgi:hypothetical protein
MPEDPDREIILEINRFGDAIEVRAVSSGDGLEVVFAAPASAKQTDIERLARAKLIYVRSRNSGGGRGEPPKDSGGKDSGGKGGVVV